MLHPTLYTDPVATRKARLLLVCCVAAGGALFALVGAAYLQRPENPLPRLVIGIGHVALCCSAFSLRFSTTMRWPAHFVTVVLCVQLVNGAWWTGGSNSSVLYAFPIAAVLVGMLGTRKHVAFTALVLTLAALWLYGLELQGHGLTATQSTPEIMLGTLIWSVLTGGGMALYASYQTDTLLRIAAEEVEHRTQAQAVAERANRSKNLFMAYLSHEIRNPLQVILTNTELLGLPDATPEENAESIESMQTVAKNLSGLLDDVLAFASIERAQINIRRDPVALAPLLQEMHALYIQDAQRKGLSLAVAEDVDVRVVADTQRLRQVLSNLIGNAVKYTMEGHVTVHVEVVGGDVKVSIRDSGPGIADDVRASIFKPFERADEGHVEGTGLGLAVSRGLITRMGSTLHLESPEQGGCLFHFTLPVAPTP